MTSATRPLRFALAALAVLVAAVTATGSSAHAAPGAAFVALVPAQASGEFDADAYLQALDGFASRAGTHPHGWAVAYRHASPPPGWTRPFVWRGGGPAADEAALHPRYRCALDEMLPVRTAAIAALRDAPDPDACFPGKPHPQPFERDGWLFLHDGCLGIEALTTGIWNADLGAGWDAFKTNHPRDYDGNADSTRGNASEIYFLLLLYDLTLTPDDPLASFQRTLLRINSLPGAASWQLNAVLLGEAGAWVVRSASAQPDSYPLYYGLSLSGEHCVTDTLPPSGSGWQAIADETLVYFPAGGAPETYPLAAAGITPGQPGASQADEPLGAAPFLAARFARAPRALTIRYRLPPHSRGARCRLFDLQGRQWMARELDAAEGRLHWPAPASLPTGLFWVRLEAGEWHAQARVLHVR